jgi:hypothetical protein
MKTISLFKIMEKLNKINYSMKSLIENKNNCYDCNANFVVSKQLVYKGEFIIKFNKINGHFICQNLNLTSLKKCPKIVNNSFYCGSNKLTSLKYCPKIVNGSFNCSFNQLTSLKGCPKEINRDFFCSYNNLISIKYCPEKVDGWFDCSNNFIKFTKKMVRKVCNVKGGICN